MHAKLQHLSIEHLQDITTLKGGVVVRAGAHELCIEIKISGPLPQEPGVIIHA